MLAESYRPEPANPLCSGSSKNKDVVVPRPCGLGINFRTAKVGGPKWNCTTDPRVISTVLCSLSYRPVVLKVCRNFTEIKNGKLPNALVRFLSPRAGCDVRHTLRGRERFLHSTDSVLKLQPI